MEYVNSLFRWLLFNALTRDFQLIVRRWANYGRRKAVSVDIKWLYVVSCLSWKQLVYRLSENQSRQSTGKESSLVQNYLLEKNLNGHMGNHAKMLVIWMLL